MLPAVRQHGNEFTQRERYKYHLATTYNLVGPLTQTSYADLTSEARVLLFYTAALVSTSLKVLKHIDIQSDMYLHVIIAGVVLNFVSGIRATSESAVQGLQDIYSRTTEADPHSLDSNLDMFFTTLRRREATDPDIEAALHIHFREQEAKKTPFGSPRGSPGSSPKELSPANSSGKEGSRSFSSPKSAGISSPRGVGTSPTRGKSPSGSPHSYGVRPLSLSEALPNAQKPMSPPRTFERVRSPPISPTSSGVKMSIPKQKKARRDVVERW